jgi:hypothetical protein
MEVKINNGVLTAEENEFDKYSIFWEPTEGDIEHLHFLGELRGADEVNVFFQAWKKLDINKVS